MSKVEGGALAGCSEGSSEGKGSGEGVQVPVGQTRNSGKALLGPSCSGQGRGGKKCSTSLIIREIQIFNEIPSLNNVPS